MPRIIDCFDKIKNKEVKLLQEAFNTLVPSDTELTEEQQREIGKKIALDYYKQINEEVSALKNNITGAKLYNLPGGEQMQGYPVTIEGLEHLDTAVGQLQGSLMWQVIEVLTGAKISEGFSKEDAISNAKEDDRIKQLDYAKINSKISQGQYGFGAFRKLNQSDKYDKYSQDIKDKRESKPLLYSAEEIQRLKALATGDMEKFFLTQIDRRQGEGDKINIDWSERNAKGEFDADGIFLFTPDDIKSLSVEEKRKRAISKARNLYEAKRKQIEESGDLFKQERLAQLESSYNDRLVQLNDRYNNMPETNPAIEKIEDEAEKEINKVDPKLPVAELPIKSKVAQRKIRNAKLSSDLDKALAELKKPTGNITTGGIDPIKLERAVTVIGLYIKGGVYKFSDIIEDAYARLGEEVKDIYDLLKTVYGGYYFNGATKKEAELMDLSERDLTFDDITQNLKSEYVDEEDFQKIENNEPRRKFIDAIKEKIKSEEKQNIISLRKIAAEYGIDVKDTTLQEMVEMAVVELGREITNSNWQDLYKLEGIIDIYDNQPTISMRSAERIEKQQYSTPIPTAYLAGLYVAAINPKSVFEPSAGNGVMTIAFDPSKVIVNEIDDVRLENLSEQNFASVTNQDALLPFSITPKDGIVMNPPFGSSPEIEVDGYKIAGLDEQMIVNALSNLSPNGRAAIIMGGHNRYDDKGRLISERTFFNYLYNHYNVDAVLNMDGQLYQKQGTQFPTRLILINGVKQNPEGATPLNTGENPVISSFYDLFKIINKLNQDGAQNILQPGVDANHANGRNIHEQGSKRSGNINQGELFGLPEGQVHPTGTGSGSAKGAPGKSDRGHSGSTGSSKSNSEEIGRNDNGIGPVPDMGEQVPPGDGRAGGIDAGGSGNEFQRNDVIQPVRKFEANDLTKNEKVPYQPKSKSASVDTVIPSQMATDAEKILTDIDNEYGGIDNFVQKKLKYPDKQALHNALSGEQIDAVAMAIVQIENGEGMIIGDMTGVGKGRVAAAVLRYAVNVGKQPIFLTEDAGLFSDFYRDLLDIGSERLVPFIVNDKSGQKNDPTITDKDGNVIHRPLSKEVKQSIFRSKTIPKNANFVLASYSQFRTSPDKPSIKRDFFQSIAQGNILILDESHNVSGDSNSGALFQDIISSTQGVLFLSATFAKRPNNMPVYALKTAMKEANMSTGELVSAIEHGGVALQEVVSSQLVESGQMLRRERAFDGVSIDYEVLDEVGEAHREIADNVTEIIRDIIDFQTVHINTLIDQLDGEAAAAGGNVKGRKGTSQAGVSNTPFANKVFNVVDQLLFSIKAIDMADAAIQELKRGRKPVVTFKSTMGSFLKYLDVQPGELLEKADFSLTLKKALEGVMRYTEKDAGGKAAYKSLSQADLTEEGRVEWRRIMNKITQVSLGITISPIDVIIKRIEDAGYSVKEITGRDARLDLRDDGTAIVATRNDKDKKKSVREFNNGDLDVLLLNVAGATGISLHASGKFKDQRQRVMIDGQLELDISKAVQKMGRIDRVGQVVRGAYRFIISAIQAEKRMLMMFKSKLKSLNANTTSSQKSETSNSDVVDFLNKYGDEVVTEYLKEERELNDKMLDPLEFNDKSDDEVNDIKSVEGAARKVTGKAAILNTREQETFYKEIIERYKDYIEYLDSNNSNDLEVKVLPLNATTINKSIIVSGKGGSTPFGQDSFLEQLEIDVLKKPLKKENIDKEIVDGLEGLTPEQKSEEIVEGINDHYEKDLAKQLDKIETQDVQNRIDVANRAREKAIKDGSSDIQGDVDGALERLEFAKNETIKRITTKNNFVNSNLTRLAKYFKIGNLYEVPISVRTDTMVGTSKGVFLGFNIKKTRKNPYAPSAITIRFAVNDSRRIVSIPLSKQDFINAIIANSNFFTPEARQKYIDNWDSLQSTRTRQQRYMMTGNLLQAFGTNDGQIVAYTDDKGGLRKGILLPEAYQVSDQKIRIPIGQSAKYLIKTGDKLTTIDKDVVIQKENTGFTITVPLSKQSGGKYFLNKGLQELVNERGFNQMSNRMTAYFSDSKLQPLLDFLQNTFNLSIEVEGGIKKAETKSSTPAEVQPISESEEKLKQKEDNRTELSKISAKLKYVFDKLLKSGSSVKASETLHGNLSEMESKILNNTINSLEALAVNKGEVSFDEKQPVNTNYEIVNGEQIKVNKYEIGGYKIELKYSREGYTEVETPSGNRLYIYDRKFRNQSTTEVAVQIFNRADNSTEFQYYEPLPENIKDLVDVIAEQMDNGITSLAAIQDYIASELGDYSEELKGQIEEAYSEYTKMNTPEEISQAINDAIEENLSVAFGGKGKVNIVDDADIVNLASNLENVQYNSIPLSTQIAEDGIPYLSESTSNTYPTPGDIQREGGSGANNLSVRASWSKLPSVTNKVEESKTEYADVVNGFYSPLEKTINEFKGDRLPAKQWAEKFKGEEAKWTGLTDWLNSQTGPISKADIQKYLKENRIEIVEVVKGGTYDENDAKYTGYQLPGEKTNYKEVLVTMPVAKSKQEYVVEQDYRTPNTFYAVNQKTGVKLKFGSYELAKSQAERLSKESQPDFDKQFKSSHFDEPNILVHLRMNTRTDSEGNKVLFLEEVQSDWGQQGKKSGFVDTEQINKLREQEATLRELVRKNKGKITADTPDDIYDKIRNENRLLEEQIYAIQTKITDLQSKSTPAAPFVTETPSWTKLGLKVALKEAVKQGANKIAWTTGEQQNERYDLSKQVDYIGYWKSNSSDGEYQLMIKPKNAPEQAQLVKEKDLEGLVGKEVAQKIINGEGEKTGNVTSYGKNATQRVIEGNGLKIGGRGMKGFYGSPSEGSLGIVGNVAKSLFKQEPKTVQIPEGKGIVGKPTVEQLTKAKELAKKANDNDAVSFLQEQIDRLNKGQEESFGLYNSNVSASKFFDQVREPSIYTQHSIDITPELRSQVQGGQPLFMKSPDGKIIGFTHNGKVYLNKKYLNPNTPIHEAGHIWTNWAEKYSVDVYNTGIRLVEGSRYYDKATTSKVYRELAKQEALKSGPEGSGAYNAAYTKYMKHEALAMAIGDRGAQFVTEAKKKGFKEWLDNLWETIKNALGFTGITTDELANLTFEEFTSRAAADILRKQKNTSSTNHKKADQTATDNLNDNLGQDDPIAAYEMNSTQKVKNFMSGDTITAALGNAPEGDQSYYAKELNQMLEDGKQMLEHFKAWVNLGQNVEDYGKQLLGYIQRMGSDAALNSKKAVLLATFLAEIAEEINRNPQKRDLLRNLNNEVTAYYQDFMRKVSTDLNAARLLRLYRDKYMGDLFVNQIMEEREIREKSDLQKAELDSKTIEDRVAEEVNRITEEMKAKAEAEQAAMAAAAAAAANKKKPGKKAEFSKEKEAAANRMKANNNTLASIIDRIKNLNCK